MGKPFVFTPKIQSESGEKYKIEKKHLCKLKNIINGKVGEMPVWE